MSVEETILFVAVIVLALALVMVVVGPKLKAGRRRQVASPPAGEGRPAAAPEAAAIAARPTMPEVVEDLPVALPEPPALAAGAGARPPPTPPQAWGPQVCPTCRRQFAAGLRFCPYDARLLTAEPSAGPVGGDREITTDPELRAPTSKICPSCARRYEMVAVVCARDGAPLVSVN